MPQASPSIESVAGELHKCNRCGFCQTRCPVYRATGIESSVARGRLALLQAALDGSLPLDNRIRSSLFECLMCRACTAECPPDIQTDRVMVAARAAYLAHKQSPIQRFIFRRLLSNPPALRLAARLLGWLKRTRLTSLSKLLRLFPWFDRGLAEGPALMPAPKTFLRARLARRPSAPPTDKHITYFLGCAIDLALPDIGEATVEILEAAGYRLHLPDNVCCGLPPYSYGDIESARTLARKNINALQSAGGDVILTDCASCASFLKDYPNLFDPDDPMRPQAEAVASRVRDLSEFLPDIDLPEALRPLNAVVTYHDPCHLSRHQLITKQPRDLLRRIPGLDYRELPEADWCCGGAGSYSLSHYDLSMQILERKMNNIRATGAEIVVTPCPACIMQLRYGASKFDVPVEVVHLTEMLRRAIPQPDRAASPAR